LRFGNERETSLLKRLSPASDVGFFLSACKDRGKKPSRMLECVDDEKDVLFVRLMRAFPFL